VKNNNQQVNRILVNVIFQVGCLNIVLIGIALGLGLWLDNFFDLERKYITILLVLASGGAALFLTMRVALSASSQAQELFNSQNLEEKTDT
jgi:hypothetical protein